MEVYLKFTDISNVLEYLIGLHHNNQESLCLVSTQSALALETLCRFVKILKVLNKSGESHATVSVSISINVNINVNIDININIKINININININIGIFIVTVTVAVIATTTSDTITVDTSNSLLVNVLDSDNIVFLKNNSNAVKINLVILHENINNK
ncbi:hypothetical protein ACTA71_010211 [Dictyostelium dimigraforme]